MTAVAVLTQEQLANLLEQAAERGAERALARGGPAILSTADAAQRAHRAEKTVLGWIRSGSLPAKKRGRSWAIRREDLDAYLSGGGSGVGVSTAAVLDSLGKG